MENQLSKQKKLDLRYLRMARIWAENSYCKRRQVGALVVKDKMIIMPRPTPSPSWHAAATTARAVHSTSLPLPASNAPSSSSSRASSVWSMPRNTASPTVWIF